MRGFPFLKLPTEIQREVLRNTDLVLPYAYDHDTGLPKKDMTAGAFILNPWEQFTPSSKLCELRALGGFVKVNLTKIRRNVVSALIWSMKAMEDVRTPCATITTHLSGKIPGVAVYPAIRK